MKRILSFIVAILVLGSISATALAKDRPDGRNWQDRPGHHDRVYRDGPGWHYRDHQWRDNRMPFRWRDHYREFDRQRMERIYDRDIERHHPGLRPYRWYGHGGYHDWFWHNGRRINDAVLFFNDNDELVSFGYMHGGVFVYVREDNEFEERDPFFFLRWFH